MNDKSEHVDFRLEDCGSKAYKPKVDIRIGVWGCRGGFVGTVLVKRSEARRIRDFLSSHLQD